MTRGENPHITICAGGGGPSELVSNCRLGIYQGIMAIPDNVAYTALLYTFSFLLIPRRHILARAFSDQRLILPGTIRSTRIQDILLDQIVESPSAYYVLQIPLDVIQDHVPIAMRASCKRRYQLSLQSLRL